MIERVIFAATLSRLVAVFCFVLLALPVRAHEVEPAVSDLEIFEDRVAIAIRLTLEAPLAGVDLNGLQDTNDASNSDLYDAKRALAPEELEAEFRAAWPRIASRITLTAGEERLTPELEAVSIPEVGNEALPRMSVVQIAAPLPEDGSPIVFGWDASLGGLIIRQQGVEEGYTAYLTSGDLSDPIPRSGASGETAWSAFVNYIGVGFDHIIPKGLDHILFVLGLFFLALKMGPLLWQVTAFTLAHTVTLALGALGLVNIPGNIVEPIIAASIVYVGIENVLSSKMQPWRPVVVFAFGLLHGLGFASVLADFGLGSSHFVPKLIGFNVGVEIGQLAVIAVAWLALGALFARFSWYKDRLASPVSIAIAVIAAFWVLERTGMIEPEGIWAPFAAITEGGMDVLWGCGIALALMAVATAIAVIVDSKEVDTVCGFVTSFAAFIAITGAFTAGSYWIMAAMTLLWVIALRIQSVGDQPSGTPDAA